MHNGFVRMQHNVHKLEQLEPSHKHDFKSEDMYMIRNRNRQMMYENARKSDL